MERRTGHIDKWNMIESKEKNFQIVTATQDQFNFYVKLEIFNFNLIVKMLILFIKFILKTILKHH